MPELQLIRLIDVADLDDIATGGAILGTGGGGDPYIGKLMAQEAIRRHGPVKLVDVDGFADDALIAPVCMMGAPTVMMEKLPQGEEIVIALRKLEKFMGRKVDGLLCGEAGGINSTTPFVAAAATDLPLIDGDGMGRGSNASAPKGSTACVIARLVLFHRRAKRRLPQPRRSRFCGGSATPPSRSRSRLACRRRPSAAFCAALASTGSQPSSRRSRSGATSARSQASSFISISRSLDASVRWAIGSRDDKQASSTAAAASAGSSSTSASTMHPGSPSVRS